MVRVAERATDSALFDTWKSIDRGREPSTVREMQASIREFRRFCKAPAPELSRQDVAGFRDHLLGKGQARATVSKKVGFISTLLQVGFDAGVLPQNVARGLKIPRAKVPTLVRRVFTTDELKRIFGSEVYSRQFRPIGGGGEACAWLPMIALVTGARLEEIAQLRTDDIRIDAAHGPLMRITDEDPDQHLKTDGSRRMVPLHTDLVRAGFLDYVEAVRDARQKWLFPDLERDHDGRRGGNFSKWFGRFLRSRRGLGISDPRVVFHCFRHTFKTLCRAALIPEDVHDALTGHVSSSVSRKYGEMPLGPLVAAIAAVKLPITLPRIDV
ncbi:Phage integrase family protein [Azoarcus sp. Aa7]|nr:Phage integrase family protein [Azoarcus sp. Aa7]